MLKKERVFLLGLVFFKFKDIFWFFQIAIKDTNKKYKQITFIYDLVTFYNQSLKHYKDHMLLIK